MNEDVFRAAEVGIELPVREVSDAAIFLENLQHVPATETPQRVPVAELRRGFADLTIDPIEVPPNFKLAPAGPLIQLGGQSLFVQ